MQCLELLRHPDIKENVLLNIDKEVKMQWARTPEWESTIIFVLNPKGKYEKKAYTISRNLSNLSVGDALTSKETSGL